MRIILSLVASCLVILVSGCATERQVAQMQGKGKALVYDANFDEVWRAAIDAAQNGDLEVKTADRNQGYIATGRGMRLATHGENVGIWVRELAPHQTQVEVVSRQAGPPKLWFKNWEDEIFNGINANLTREAGRHHRVMEPAGSEIYREETYYVDPSPDTAPPVYNGRPRY